MQLVYCQKCKNPIAKVAPGSRIEVRCHRCGIKTYVDAERRPLVLPVPRAPRILAAN